MQNSTDIWQRFNEGGPDKPRKPLARPLDEQAEQPTLLEYAVTLEEKIAALDEQLDELRVALHELQQGAADAVQ